MRDDLMNTYECLKMAASALVCEGSLTDRLLHLEDNARTHIKGSKLSLDSSQQKIYTEILSIMYEDGREFSPRRAMTESVMEHCAQLWLALLLKAATRAGVQRPEIFA